MDGRKDARKMEDKWGTAVVKAGWTGLPNILLARQAEMGLSSLDLVVLANVVRFWWIKERWPYPSLDRIATSMGVDEERVRKSISKMHRLRLLRRIRRDDDSVAYDLSGLLAVLEQAVVERLKG